MQRLGDRQKIWPLTGVPVSDTRLPLVMFDSSNCTTLEGRILAHGERKRPAASFMMLEGTDGQGALHLSQRLKWPKPRPGGLRANRFVRMRKVVCERAGHYLRSPSWGHSKGY